MLHTPFRRAVLAAALSLPPAASAADHGHALIGYDTTGSTQQRALESRFDTLVDQADYRGWLKQWAAQPNHVGAPHNLANAQDIQRKLQSYGWETRIEEYQVYWPAPRSVQLELLAPTAYRARLSEPALREDATSGLTEDVLPPYVIYAGNGEVTADLVYVNYGLAEDYELLARQGVDVKGKIVIARYGKGWRGLKPRLAQEHGAVGTLIYSDPRDDGYYQDLAYPQGPARNEWSVQRGSVLNFALYPGDPLTPGIAAVAGAPRLPPAQAVSLLRIPTLPISWGDAKPLLAALAGPVAPEAWRGALPLTYRVGGDGGVRLRLKVDADGGTRTLYNVIATLRGSDYPDQWVVRGNHRDAWVLGAADPLSGTASLLAEAQAIGALAAQGVRPKRTLVYASWDGEEAGLLGSTEWVEQHAEELRSKAVLYVNTDGNGRGFLDAGGSHALQRLVNEVAADLRDPDSGVSVQQRWRAKAQVDALAPDAKPAAREVARRAAAGEDLPLKALGSGSDYSPFLQHLGLPTLDLSYGGQGGGGGVYHSLYDSYDYYARYVDPGFQYLPLLARTVGRTVLRTANAPVLPQRFQDLAVAIEGFAKDVQQQADTQRGTAQAQKKLIDSGAFAATSNPNRPLKAPVASREVPPIDFSALNKTIAQLKESAQQLDQRVQERGTSLSAERQLGLNQAIQALDQALLTPQGLPGRSWYRNLVYAPGLATGYEVKTLPGIREALEDGRWDDLVVYLGKTTTALEAYRRQLDTLREQLQR